MDDDEVDDIATNVGDALVRGELRLRDAGIEEWGLEARLLLGHVLQVSHLEVGIDRARPLTPSESGVFHDLVAARARRRPIQHLLGDVDFYGRSFRVGPGVLIPRPETESAIEAALEVLPPGTAAHVAEVGAGAGVLAVTIACERLEAQVWCNDISDAALRLTRLNAAAHGVESRVHALPGDLLAPLAAHGPFDLLISNPPYIPSGDIAGLAPEVRDHDPRAALDGGPDGLDVVRRLLDGGSSLLRTSGRIVLELGYDQGPAVRELAVDAGWSEIEILPDLAGRDRVLRARRAPSD
jgi:release factor glutamine methyltransferase